jgi:uncharacterized membrane protein YedE/YeeE
VLGALFGWALHKAGLTQYARIVNVYRLRDWTVIRFMLSALLVGAVGIQCSAALGLTRAALPVPPTWLLANLAGGAIFGLGMASAGYCPGTIIAEAGEGRLDALFAGVAGLVVGALLFGALQPRIMPALTRLGALGRVTLPDLIGAKPWLVLLVFAELVALLLLATRRGTSKAEPGSPTAPS